MVRGGQGDLDDHRSLWVLEGRLVLVNLEVQAHQVLQVVLDIQPILSLQNGLMRSHHRGLPLVLADPVDQVSPAVQGFLHCLDNLSHPSSRYSPALLWALVVHPDREDLEVLEFLEILVTQPGLLFLSDPLVPEVHRYPSLHGVQWVPQVRGILGLLAAR